MTRKHESAPSGRFFKSAHFWPVFLILTAIVAANCLYLLGVFDPNPLNLYAGLSYITHQGVLPGSPSADPNSGITSQALGHLAALDWLHGQVPWWNSYEGLGSPLAGEMQSAAFFPPTLLLYFSNGQVYFHLILEVVAGLSTYALLVTLKLRRAIGVTGAIAFALCGMFSWFSNAPVNPIAFLPLVLIGVELTANGTKEQRDRGWISIAVGLALSLYAGFPEVAYIDGLFVAVWAISRLVGLSAHDRYRYLLRLGSGAVIGLLLALPILVAFIDYVRVGDVGAHSGVFGAASNAKPAISQVLLPYVYGPIPSFSADSTPLGSIWAAGGYLTAPIFALALVGLRAKPYRALRIGLALWIVVALGRSYGVAPFQQLINVLPGMNDIAFQRYSDPTWTLAGIVLAAMGIEDILQRRVTRSWIGVSGIVGLVVVGLSVLEARTVAQDLRQVAHHQFWDVASIIWAASMILVVFLVALVRRRSRLTLIVISTALVANALVMFIVPQFSAPRAARLYPAPAEFLASHLGSSRFYSIGPLEANYGSYFGLASLASNDLPQPTLYDKFFAQDFGISGLSTSPASVSSFTSHLAQYENAGVKYLVTAGGPALPSTGTTAQLRLVLAAPSGNIYQLPDPRPIFTASPDCVISSQNTEAATVSCSSAGVLVRRELFMAGWTAATGAQSLRVQPDGAFQRVRLPPGRHVVSFSFLPPHELEAFVGFLLGAVFFVGGLFIPNRWLFVFGRKRRPRDSLAITE